MKKHSTSAEALLTASAMGAYRTVLTHFSQRYPHIPDGLPDSAAKSAMLAFDGMRITLSQLPRLPRLMPSITAVFEVEAEE